MATRWDAYDCNLPQTTPQSFVECVSVLKIDFIGDSHVRILYNHILRSFCGVPQAAQNGWGESHVLDLMKCLSVLVFQHLDLFPLLGFYWRRRS